MFIASAVHSYFHLADEQTHTTGNYTFTTQTYFGAPMQLGPGHMIFTNPLHTPLKMPIGKYAILGFTGDIVDENQGPLSDSDDDGLIVGCFAKACCCLNLCYS